MHLKKVALVVEYDGARFHGFQAQVQSPTVQQELERAVRAFTGEDVRVVCASRTDAGVSARAQVVSLRTGAEYPAQTFVGALNHYLPVDVGVTSACEVPMDFDVRKEAVGRRYRYLVLNRLERSPLLGDRAHLVTRALDVEAMRHCAEALRGRRDFAPFAGSLTPDGAPTVKNLAVAEIARDGLLVTFHYLGSSFLHQQVRRMTGTLVEVGLGKLTVEAFEAMMACGRRGVAGPTLPARPLTLEEVIYPDFPSSKQTANEKSIAQGSS